MGIDPDDACPCSTSLAGAGVTSLTRYPGSQYRTLLQCRLGQALSILRELDQAKRELDASLVHAEASHNIEIMQETVYTLAGLYASMDYATSHAYAERAVSPARGCHDSILEASSLNRLGNVMTNV